jgi:hypothetical protein
VPVPEPAAAPSAVPPPPVPVKAAFPAIVLDESAIEQVLKKRKAIVASLSRVEGTEFPPIRVDGTTKASIEAFGNDDVGTAKRGLANLLLYSNGACGNFTHAVNKVICAYLSRVFEDTHFEDKTADIKTVLCTTIVEINNTKGVLLIEPKTTSTIDSAWFNMNIRRQLPALTAMYEWRPKADTVFGPNSEPPEPSADASWPSRRIVTTILAVRASREETVMNAKEPLLTVFKEHDLRGQSDLATFVIAFERAKSKDAVIGIVSINGISNANATSFKHQVNNFIGDVFAKFARETSFRKTDYVAFFTYNLGDNTYVIGEPSAFPPTYNTAKYMDLIHTVPLPSGFKRWQTLVCLYKNGADVSQATAGVSVITLPATLVPRNILTFMWVARK